MRIYPVLFRLNMVRNYVRKSEKGSWTVETMSAAVDAVKAGMALATAARTFCVPRNTLRDKIKTGCVRAILGGHPTFTTEQEEQLEERIRRLDACGYGLTITDLRRIAYRFAELNDIPHRFNKSNKMAGYEWVYGYMSRHPNLSVRKAEGLSFARARGMTKENVDKFFLQLSKCYDELQLWDKPGSILNCDESGLQLIYKPGKVVSVKGKKEVYAQTNVEKGETVTIMACVTACGQFMPPFVIMKGQRKNDSFSVGMPPGTTISMSEKGYMTGEVFLKFLDHLATYKPEGPILLILDGHSSHSKDLKVLEHALELGITMLCLPPHSTHVLQPLDVSFFKPLKQYYNEACRLFLRANPGKTLSKAQFGHIFNQAWMKAASASTGISGFRSTGIFPFDPSQIPDHAFLPSLIHSSSASMCSEEKEDDHSTSNLHTQDQPTCSRFINSLTVESTRTEATSMPPGPTSDTLVTFHDLTQTPQKPSGSSASRRQRNSRKYQQGGVVLTSPMYIGALKTKKRLFEQKTRGKRVLPPGTKRPATTHGHSMYKSCYCPICKVEYNDSPDGGDWVQCTQCKTWYHELCVDGGNDPFFVCSVCSDTD